MIILAAFLATAVPQSDSDAAVMFVQSYTIPALFDVCKSAMPNRAGEFDRTFSAWIEKNTAIVARGESVVRERAKQDNMDVDVFFSSQRQSMVSQLKSLSAQDKKEKCEYLLEVTRAEN